MAARYVRYAAAAAAIGGAAYGIYRYIADAECLAGACIRAPRRRSSLGHLASPLPRRGGAEAGAVRRIGPHRRVQPVQRLSAPQARSFAKAKRLPQTLRWVLCACADEEDLPEVEGNHSKLLRYQKGSRWQGIETQEYKAEGTAEFKRAYGPAARCACSRSRSPSRGISRALVRRITA
jgi:hypothetical protein